MTLTQISRSKIKNFATLAVLATLAARAALVAHAALAATIESIRWCTRRFCMFVINFFMVYNAVFSVSVSVCLGL